MKTKAFCALIALSVLVLIGCTACDNDPTSGSIDLTEDRLLLCNPAGWDIQEHSDAYAVGPGEGVPVDHLMFIANTENPDIVACQANNGANVIDGGFIDFTGDIPIVTLSQGGAYRLKITTNPDESNPVLSLKAADSTALVDEMYFSLGGGA